MGESRTEGWTLVADPGACTLIVEHARLGCLLTNVQLNIPTGQELVPAKGWTVTSDRQGLLRIKTVQPQSTWLLELGPLALKISCTAPEAVLTAQVPVGRQRTIARLLDREGFPVEWTGTDEVANGYGGTMTRNPSFLPRQNPECMYFALGRVSGGVFHSLFDRATDTAIEFPDQARLANSERLADSLELTLAFSGSVQVRVMPDYYTKTLGLPFYVPFDERCFPRPPMVWCSWTSYYGDVTEQEVVRNADWLAEHLKPYGFQYVQLDDGYDSGLKAGHYWIEHWDARKFPHGPKWLADYIKSKGLHPGLWLVPNAYAGAVEAHPEWYLRDKQGNIILDYGTPALDSTNPEVLDFLKHLFTTLGEWGFEYYKFDGEHALPKYVPPWTGRSCTPKTWTRLPPIGTGWRSFAKSSVRRLSWKGALPARRSTASAFSIPISTGRTFTTIGTACTRCSAPSTPMRSLTAWWSMSCRGKGWSWASL